MRIAHISDLHFGHHDARLAETLAADIASQNPDLVVVSGDFTQIGSRAEFVAARTFLDRLTAPVFAVPGNHDVPAVDLMRRFLDPYGHYRRYISPDLEPLLEVDGVAIAGLKTVRRLRAGLNWAQGTIGRRQLLTLAARFGKASPDAVRIVVAHHPLLLPEEAMQKPMRRVDNADRALEAFARLGVRLVLSGHFHLSYVRKRENGGAVVSGLPKGARESAVAPILVAQASSTISTRLRGEPNAYNLIDIVGRMITVTVREWRGEAWFTRDKASASA
ncbi:MAG TPA: metallophosphoesterase [Devosiaceae bacterium]|nr:metallophosphoesterase [Devosiaceae bacterium]